jgi:hypothetical protein
MSSERAIIVDLRALPRLSRVSTFNEIQCLKWAYFLMKIKDKIIKKSEKLSHSSFKIF